MDYLKELKGLALGSRMRRIVEKLNSEVKSIYISKEIDFDPFLMPVMNLLRTKGNLNINQIVEYLGISQPAVTQFCNTLTDKGLIETKIYQKDKRIRELVITQKGHNTLEKLIPVWNEIADSINSIIKTSDHNLLIAIENFENQMNEKSLKDRVIDGLNEKKQIQIEIIDYQEEFKDLFKSLNYEWIEKFFVIEPSDVPVLSNPKETIIDKGGYIFFAMFNNEIIGTFALIKVDDNTYEIAKMAVTEKYQKHGIGSKLMDFAIQKSKCLNIRRLILYSNTNLAPAVNMYIKYGFRVVPKEDYHTERANIKMEKTLVD